MNIKIQLLKFLDFTAGNVFCELSGLLPERSNKGSSSTAKKILIIRPGGIGDAVLLIPALKKLREKFPDADIDILAERRNSAVFQNFAEIDRLYCYDDLKALHLVKVLRKKYDIVIDTEQWHRLSAVIAYLTNAPIRTGFGTNRRKKLFTNPVDYEQDDYETISFIKLLKTYLPKDKDKKSTPSFLEVKTSDRQKFTKDIGGYRKKFNKVAGIFAGATVRERRWGVVNYAMLAEKLLENNTGVVLLGGPGERSDSDLFNRILFDKDVLDYTGRTSLPETAAIVSMLDLFISADTGLMHVAYGVGTNTVSLFGAGIESKWAPEGKGNVVINKNLFCSPCTSFGYTPSCPYQVRCLREISVDEVYNECLRLL